MDIFLLVTAFFSSDRDGSGNASDSDGDRDSEDRDRDEEDVLAKQAREREQAAVDIAGALLGAMVGLFAKELVRDAVSLAAPSKVKKNIWILLFSLSVTSSSVPRRSQLVVSSSSTNRPQYTCHHTYNLWMMI